MNTRTTLLASAAIAGLSLVNAAGAMAADWYVNVSGGANWADEGSVNRYVGTVLDNTTFSFDNDTATGFVISGAAGLSLTQYLPGLRAEVELGIRENNVRGRWATSDVNFIGPDFTAVGVLDYQQSTFSALANVWYDFKFAGLNPYVGGGIGWSNTKLDGNFTDSGFQHAFSEEESGFAFQLGAGLTADIQPGLKANLGYRYLQGPDLTITDPHNGLTGDIDNRNHTVTVGLTYDM